MGQQPPLGEQVAGGAERAGGHDSMECFKLLECDAHALAARILRGALSSCGATCAIGTSALKGPVGKFSQCAAAAA